MSDRADILLLDRAGPLFFRKQRWVSVVNFPRVTLLHASSFVVYGSSVKQVSHSWHIVLDTCALCTFLNFICLLISLLNLYPDSELIITDIISKNLHSVCRSIEFTTAH